MDYDTFRNKMVDEQLIPREISDKRVLEVFRKVARHEFVPEDLRDNAYEDRPLPIDGGQTISQPYMVALMTQCLGLKGHEKILEVGTGSGYQAAILANLAKEVYSVERVKSLAKSAESVLKNAGFTNVTTKLDDGTLGWKEHAPYDGIIVTAAAPKVPDAYIEQLKIGGKLVIPLGTMFSQVLTVIEKKTDTPSVNEVCGCVFVPLVGKDGWKK